MKKTIYATALAAVATLALAACGDAPEDDSTEPAGEATTEEATGSAEEVDYLACLISDQGGWEDQSFNQSAMEGGMRAQEELGIQLNDAESQSDADFGPNVDSMVQQGCDMTIGVGFLLEDPIQAAAEGNTDVNFGLVDATFSDPGEGADAPPVPVELPNAAPIIFNTAEAAYLAGYVAAGMSETGTVATFGGLPIPSVNIFMDGFVDGVAKFNEDNDGDVQVLGWDKEAQDGTFSGGFEDQGQGQALTEQFIAQGADVIMPVAGPVGLGAAAAAESAGDVWIVGVDSDWTASTDYADIVLASVVKEIGAGVFETIKAGLEGSFTGEPYIGDLANGGVSLATGSADIPQELLDQVEGLQEQIISGELAVETVNAP
ncbi:nucleoside-binding protein [Georgenia satyanarayanai]|uniref:Nucleoside-binding protein n=1 Tax=Georgenia satyanarayanai TaxID=860221 RepID=A0A2Y9A7N2_9MICO|nr:BMP family ABC transporter substrate-binding protein [Georgenia satyanarayanai]PYG00587.1 nucleoside-binding protein [Georgenia satyanarayanai]SSA39976.1 nucleoside-binding protein [Georgenia satyanarayanai]